MKVSDVRALGPSLPVVRGDARVMMVFWSHAVSLAAVFKWKAGKGGNSVHNGHSPGSVIQRSLSLCAHKLDRDKLDESTPARSEARR